MLDEIRSFFEALRGEPAPTWPEGVSPINPVTGENLQAVSELHWRLATQSLDELEIKIVGLYDAGEDEPALIDLMDEVVAIIRRKGELQGRVREIVQLLQTRGAQTARG